MNEQQEGFLKQANYALAATVVALIFAEASNGDYWKNAPLWVIGLIGAALPLSVIGGALVQFIGWNRLRWIHKAFVTLGILVGISACVFGLIQVNKTLALGFATGVLGFGLVSFFSPKAKPIDDLTSL